MLANKAALGENPFAAIFPPGPYLRLGILLAYSSTRLDLRGLTPLRPALLAITLTWLPRR